MALPKLNRFKIGDDFIETYLTYDEIKELFDKVYKDKHAPSLLTKLGWFTDHLATYSKAQKVNSGFIDLTYKL